MHSLRSRKKFSLQFHIIALFTMLITISGLSLGWHSYAQLSTNTINSGKALFSNSSKEVVENIRSESAQINSMLKMIESADLINENSKQQKLDLLPLISEMISSTPSLSALFIAYADNDFFLYREIESNIILDKYSAPKNSAFMMTLRENNKTIHQFYDVDLNMLFSYADAKYDLKISTRPWYKLAKESDSFSVTKPYLFHTNQEFGLTMSRYNKDNKSFVGADYTLGNLSKLLKEGNNYPSTQRVIVDHNGQVISYQNFQKLKSKQQRFDRFKTINDIDQPQLAHLFQHYAEQEGSFLFSFEGEDWLADISTISERSDLVLLQIVKTNELLSKAYQLRYKSVFITLLIIIATLPVAWFFARLLTAPIRELTLELQKIKNFDFNETTHKNSYIKEISELINITDQMKGTIYHFQELSASLVSKQSFKQLLSEIGQEFNKIPNSQGTLIILSSQQSFQVKHCNLSSLDNDANKLLRQQMATLSLSPTALQGSCMPVEIEQLISQQQNNCQNLIWQLVTMKNRSGENLGFIAILLERHKPLNEGIQKYAQAIASFSALSVQSQQLLAEQKQLLESFIHIIAGAIDSKSPYTGSHCERVPELTKMLARAACDDTQGTYKDFDLSEDQWEELHIAAWLHDCGKILTPEYVVDKSTKLEAIYDRFNEIRMRFELLKNDAEKHYWQQLSEGGDKQQLAEQRDALLAQLDQEFEFVADCNIGGEFMSDDKIARLHDIAKRTWTRTLSDKIGLSLEQASKISDTALPTNENLLADKSQHLVEKVDSALTKEGNQWGFNMATPEHSFNRGELYNLSVQRGTLTPEDRFIINGHMIHTIMMLSQLPFPKHLQDIPTIAGGHHEKMDGSGYPRGIKAAELPVSARMMVIADIFEALTASDRPYKESKTIAEAINIMNFMVKDDHIDPDVFKLFLSSGVYLQYAKVYLKDEQLDEVDIDQYL